MTDPSASGRRRLLTPNYWRAAVRCFSKAVTCHRRLIKLAPEQFDHVSVNRQRARAEKERATQARWEAAFVKVYGLDASAAYRRILDSRTAVKPRSKAVERAIEREFDDWQRWLDAGREAITLFRRHKQWSRVGLADIASLVQVAHQLGRLSTGLDTTWREPTEPGSWDFEAAVERISRANLNGAQRIAGTESVQESSFFSIARDASSENLC